MTDAYTGLGPDDCICHLWDTTGHVGDCPQYSSPFDGHLAEDDLVRCRLCTVRVPFGTVDPNGVCETCAPWCSVCAVSRAVEDGYCRPCGTRAHRQGAA